MVIGVKIKAIFLGLNPVGQFIYEYFKRRGRDNRVEKVTYLTPVNGNIKASVKTRRSLSDNLSLALNKV